jgi:hypothetical protein
MALSLLALLVLAPQTVRLAPTDDIWVYPHASDPAHDVNLRIWGASGNGVPADTSEAEEMSLALLRWDVSGVPVGKKLVKATLVVTNIANPGYTLAQAAAAPLEARPVRADFDEKTWEYEKLEKYLPKKELFGSANPPSFEKDKPVPLEINLLKGPSKFAAYLDSSLASSEKTLALALTSAMDMASIGRSGMYKIYSRDEKDEALRPSLVLTFE